MAVHDMAIQAESSRIGFKPETLITENPEPETLILKHYSNPPAVTSRL